MCPSSAGQLFTARGLSGAHGAQEEVSVVLLKLGMRKSEGFRFVLRKL